MASVQTVVIYLARHGETDANLAHRYAGRSPEGLTRAGRTQVEKLAQRLAGRAIRAVWTSELVRACETAEIVARALGAQVVVDPDLAELEMGPWEGLTEHEVARRFPAEYQLWLEQPDRLELPGRETLEAVRIRLVGTVDRAAMAPSPVLLISHVAPIRVTILDALGLPLRLYKRVTVGNAECFEICRALKEVRRLGAATSIREELLAPRGASS